MSNQRTQFTALMRVLHWTMAAMVLTMLGIGVTMVASLADYHTLVSIHRPLGAGILILVVVRFVVRWLSPLPPFPPTMSRLERVAASASEYTMYGLMFVLPLVGWGMLSAARYPAVLFGSVHLPFILPHDAMLHATLRRAHTVLAYLLFLTFLAHFGAILFHTLIVGDGMLLRMVPWNDWPREVGRGGGRPTSRSERFGHRQRQFARFLGFGVGPSDAPVPGGRDRASTRRTREHDVNHQAAGPQDAGPGAPTMSQGSSHEGQDSSSRD